MFLNKISQKLHQKNFELIKSLCAKLFSICILGPLPPKISGKKKFELCQND